MKVFVGLVTGTNMYVMGQLSNADGQKYGTLVNVVRVFESQNERGQIGFSFHPDPYFSTGKEVRFAWDSFLLTRIEEDESDKMVTEYNSFFNKFRMAKAGLVSGVTDIGKAKSLIMEGS